MELFDAISQRRTHRGEFRTDAISQEHLDQLIQAAQWAPSPFNTPPWEFLIIREDDGKNALAELTAQSVVDQFKDSTFLDDNSRWMRLTEAEWEERGDGVLLTDHVDLPPVFRKDPSKLKSLLKHAKYLSILGHLGAGKLPAKEISELVRTAPLLILILMDNTRRPPGEGGDRWMWLGMGAAIQNLLLTATSLGIGTQFVSAPLESQEDRERIQELFNIPDSHEIINLLRLGYVDSTHGTSVRLPSSTIIRHETY